MQCSVYVIVFVALARAALPLPCLPLACHSPLAIMGNNKTEQEQKQKGITQREHK